MKLPDKYHIQKEELRIENSLLEIMTISNTDEVYDHLLKLDANHEDVKDERIPYWIELWPASLALSRHILRYPALVEGKSVLEIACGLGLPGICAGLMAAHVRMSDYLPDALEFASANWSLNVEKEAETFLLDWRQPHPRYAAQVLLASDIVYESRSYPFVLEAFKQLCHHTGVILFSEPCRSQSKTFIELLKKEFPDLRSFSYLENRKGREQEVMVYEIRFTKPN